MTSDSLGPNVDRRVLVSLASKTGDSLRPICMVCNSSLAFSILLTCMFSLHS